MSSEGVGSSSLGSGAYAYGVVESRCSEAKAERPLLLCLEVDQRGVEVARTAHRPCGVALSALLAPISRHRFGEGLYGARLLS